MRLRSSSSRRSSRPRSRSSSSPRRSCTSSRSSRLRPSERNRRRRPWRGRSTRRSRNSRRWSAPGITSPKARITSSWQGDPNDVRLEKETTPVKRRRFIVKAGGALAAAGAAVAVEAPHVIAQPKIQWRMSTAWTKGQDILQSNAQRLGQVVDEMSGGRFRIEVMPGGQIMPPFECFEATSKGTDIQAYMGSPQYWSAREPALEWFATIPFGMNPEGMAAWFYQGDGLKLMEEAYGAFNIVPRPAMGDAPQMAGWFRKRINTTSDFKGLRIRVPNLGGKVYARAGATTVLTPGSDIYPALERGVIDAAEWIGPHYDMQINLHKTARYYYYPGWHEPGTTQDF